MFKGILRLIVVGWIGSMVVGMIAAMNAKRRVGPNTDESADEIAVSAIFGPLAYHSTARDLRGGRVELWYGGGVLDLRDALISPRGATLELRAVFGGGQILVPADWRVVSNIRGLGGLQDIRAAKSYADDAPVLVIDGLLIAGGFAVQSELDADGADFYEEAIAKRHAAHEIASSTGPATQFETPSVD